MHRQGQKMVKSDIFVSTLLQLFASCGIKVEDCPWVTLSYTLKGYSLWNIKMSKTPLPMA